VDRVIKETEDKKLAFFWPISRFISKTVTDTAIVTVEDDQELVGYAIHRMVPFPMTLSDPYRSRSRIIQRENGAI